MLVEIEDGSGDIDVRDVAGVRITGGSGEVDVAGVSGDLVVSDDGSGNLDLRDVAGTVEIEVDGSGAWTQLSDDVKEWTAGRSGASPSSWPEPAIR